MPNSHYPVVQTLATFDADLTCGGLSFDVDGNCYVSQNQIGLLLVHAGAKGMCKVPLDFLRPEDFLCCACTPDGKLLFIRTDSGAIWRVNMLAPDKAGAAELVVLPATDQPQPHCTGLRVTDTHLWFWRSVYQLMRLDVTKTGAEARAELVATLQLPSNREQKIPSWQLDPATWMVYYKTQINDSEVIVLDVRSGTQHTTTIPGMPAGAEDSEEGTWMAGCTGDGQILLVQEPSPLRVLLWDLSNNNRSAKPQLVAEFDTAEDTFPMDSVGGSPAVFAYLFSVSIDAAGKLWVYDDGRDAGFPSTLRCVHTDLTPPFPFQEVMKQRGRWHIGDVSSQISKDFASVLESGVGADVHIVAAGEVVLPAHSVILTARWPWFRAQQERWQHGEHTTGCEGQEASGSAGSAVLREVNARHHSPDVMRVLLRYLYTGGAVLMPEDVGSTADGCSTDAAGDTHALLGSSRSHSSSTSGAQGCSSIDTAGAAGAIVTPCSTSATPFTAPKLTRPMSTTARMPRSNASGSGDEEQEAGEVLVGVMHAAAGFELPVLQTACVEAAKCHISIYNALPWLVAAYPYSAVGDSDYHDPGFQGLKILALNYAAHHYAEIKKSAPGTIDLLRQQPGDLAVELMEACLALI